MPPNEIGIVLSGGGIRGIAHIGVLRALFEHDVYPDRIAGASAGAIVGALYAAGYDPPEMLEFFEKKNSFEALKRKLHVLATDLTRGEPVEFHAGELIPAVLASSAYPGMFTPIEIDGHIYADGGIVNNFPSELLAGHCKVLLGVHTSEMREMSRSDFGNALSVLKRAFEVGVFRTSRAKYGTCHVVVRPPDMARFGIFETKYNDEIEAIGYEAALERMPEILRAVHENAYSDTAPDST